ncbi:HD domain-containing protein [Candidatus Peregrinibacteria bacterium]|nr:HD domain-containing protein [Candidatus Peregrinibacteria bacterium]
MTVKKAIALLKKMRLPDHIVDHTKQVAYTAGLICDEYKKKHIKINKNRVVCAALLHDLFKILDIRGAAYKSLCKNASKKDIAVWNRLKKEYGNVDHAIAAYTYLKSIGENKIALMVRKHKFDAVCEKQFIPVTLEEKITTYADKRVLHSKIVSLKKRFSDGEKRYNPKKENLEKQKMIHRCYFQMEREIFKKIKMRPEDIK